MKTELLLEKIKDEFPELEWTKYRHLKHSWDFDVIILDEKIVFRFPQKGYLKNVLEREIQLLSYLKNKVKVIIPEYKYVSKDKLIGGYDVVLGQKLTLSCFKNLSGSEREFIAQQLSEFITTLHSTPKSIVEKINIEPHDQEAFYEDLVNETKELIFPRINKKEVSIVKQYFKKLKTALDYDVPNILVHGDLGSSNILWDEGKKQIGVIDFGDCALGDPAIDFANLPEYGLEFTKRVLGSYECEKDRGMLQRALLYFKIAPLRMMRDSFQGRPCTFEQGYEMFRDRFLKCEVARA